jgi:hypothetical protein
VLFRLQYYSQGRGFSKYPRPPANPQTSPYELPTWMNFDYDKLSFDQSEPLCQVAQKLGIDPRNPPKPYVPNPTPAPPQTSWLAATRSLRSGALRGSMCKTPPPTPPRTSWLTATRSLRSGALRELMRRSPPPAPDRSLAATRSLRSGALRGSTMRRTSPPAPPRTS